MTSEAQGEQIERFVRLLFHARFITPTVDEYGMYFAHAAALRSADPSRQVGAVIMSPKGELLTAGCNEVPEAGGGAHWEGQETKDHRDFITQEIDPNVSQKYELLRELFAQLKHAGWLNPDVERKNEEDLIHDALYNPSSNLLQGTRIDSLLEFGRVVHAEMQAITESAKRGVRIESMVLYCTTYPCHMCARHIISAGLRRVVFIEPYPKSLAQDLYEGVIRVDGCSGNRDADFVHFEPFIGLSPRQYQKLFRMVDGSRKDEAGQIVSFDAVEEYPRIEKPEFDYEDKEDSYISSLLELIGITESPP
ncbi:MAG: hypothetical protein EOM26_13650 [Alphaproteobacteria bacterium]|nr:hypothetical protein [Alphaproteobacteria bacterium]